MLLAVLSAVFAGTVCKRPNALCPTVLQVRSAGASSAKDLVPAPNLDKHVFCRVLEDRGHVTVDEEG